MIIKFFHRRILPIIILGHLCVTTGSLCFSQEIIKNQSQNERNFLVRTKQFNEFADRFNYKSDFDGNPVSSSFISKMPRSKLLSSLFDLKDLRISPSDKRFSKEYVDIKSEFINYVIGKNLFLNKYSDKIVCEAKSHIIYKGSPEAISIFLTQEIIGKDMVKWVLVSAKGDIFNFYKPDTAYIRFIPPSSNETDFINLKRALEDIDHLQDYATRDYHPDNLSVLFYMLNSGLAKHEYVEEVIYHIFDIPGWSFTVREFNRNEMNSGWLISDISKNKQSITDYLKNIN